MTSTDIFKRYVIERQPTLTICDEPHPVRLPRSEWYEGWRNGERVTVKGYRCPGGMEHEATGQAWHIWDTELDEYATFERFDTKRAAQQWLAGANQ